VKTQNLMAWGILLAAVIGAVLYVYQNKSDRLNPTRVVPAILEDSISDETNMLLDTISGKATPESDVRN
jgi:hypothetical protein